MRGEITFYRQRHVCYVSGHAIGMRGGKGILFEQTIRGGGCDLRENPRYRPGRVVVVCTHIRWNPLEAEDFAGCWWHACRNSSAEGRARSDLTEKGTPSWCSIRSGRCTRTVPASEDNSFIFSGNGEVVTELMDYIDDANGVFSTLDDTVRTLVPRTTHKSLYAWLVNRRGSTVFVVV